MVTEPVAGAAAALHTVGERQVELRPAIALEGTENFSRHTLGMHADRHVAPPAHVPLSVEDLSGLPVDMWDEETRRLAVEGACKGFELNAGSVWRTRLLRLSEEEHVLLVTMHHIVSDAWSLGVLVREVGALYRARVEGIEAELSELPVQYGDYSEWQRGWLEGGALACVFWSPVSARIQPASANSAVHVTSIPRMSMLESCAASRRTNCSRCRPTGSARPSRAIAADASPSR